MNKDVLAYIIGIALGDGNLSNPNGRATRLRITCDSKYPKVKDEIVESLQLLLPNNSVSIIATADTYCKSASIQTSLMAFFHGV